MVSFHKSINPGAFSLHLTSVVETVGIGKRTIYVREIYEKKLQMDS